MQERELPPVLVCLWAVSLLSPYPYFHYHLQPLMDPRPPLSYKRPPVRHTNKSNSCWNHRNLNEATHRQIHRYFGGVNMTLLRLLMRQGRAGHVMDNELVPLDTPSNVLRLRGIPFFLFVGADNKVLSPAATERTYSVLRETFGDDGKGGVAVKPTEEVAEPQSGVDNEPRDTEAQEENATTEANGEAADTVTTANPSPISPTDTKAEWVYPEMMYRRRVIPGYGHLDTFLGRDSWRDVFPYIREEIDRVVRGPEYTFEEPKDRFYGFVSGGSGL